MFENETETISTEFSKQREVFGMIKRHPALTGLVLLLVVAGLFLVLRPTQATTTSNKPNLPKPAEERKLPVEVATAQNGSISSSITTTASLEPDRQVTMISETNGIVAKLLVEEGDRVKEGQVLAELANREKQVALQKAMVHLEDTKQELNRKQMSYNEHIISQSEFEKARYESQTAEAERNAAQVELDRTTIRAPFSGIVTARFIEKGQNINTTTQLFTILDAEPLQAKIYLPEKEIYGISENQKIDLALNAQKNVAFAGHVRQINPAVDPKTGTVKVTIEITNPPSAVRPGSFVDVKLVTQRHDNVVLIPKKALIDEAGERYVFLIEKNLAVRRNVKVGFLDDTSAEVLSGIKQGDAVVVAGQGSLRDGAKTETVAQR
jgi:membrane fusion protein (multidrug efflux system)